MTQAISDIKAVLKSGGVVTLPTETVYGIAARADDSAAIDRIYAIKGRNFNKPLAVCVSGIAQAEHLAIFSPVAQTLALTFWPGPLTLVLPTKDRSLDERCYQGETIALRCPDIEWREMLLSAPLALTSANRSGDPATVNAETGLAVDAALNGGPSQFGQASTILSVEDGKIRCLRTGALGADRLAKFDISWPE